MERRRDDMPGVSSATMKTESMETAKKLSNKPYKNQFTAQSKNLASIIRGFKSAVTMQAKNLGYHHFAWQTRFHEHIISDEKSFQNIEEYILNNPQNWKDDVLYSI
ncbi:MAG: hypothetical protein EOP53_12910 [Sphingobacteriales bacterium]|nr:MAG: hypothetical protein EOP53_12910 [Sphingobacteriales bacterium]